MVDACTITHSSGAVAQNETTGQVARAQATVYSGPCRVQTPQAQPRTADVVDRAATLQELTVSIPVGTGQVRVGAIVTMTACTLDTELVGRTFVVTGVHHKTHATAQRLQCEETTR